MSFQYVRVAVASTRRVVAAFRRQPRCAPAGHGARQLPALVVTAVPGDTLGSVLQFLRGFSCALPVADCLVFVWKAEGQQCLALGSDCPVAHPVPSQGCGLLLFPTTPSAELAHHHRAGPMLVALDAGASWPPASNYYGFCPLNGLPVGLSARWKATMAMLGAAPRCRCCSDDGPESASDADSRRSHDNRPENMVVLRWPAAAEAASGGRNSRAVNLYALFRLWRIRSGFPFEDEALTGPDLVRVVRNANDPFSGRPLSARTLADLLRATLSAASTPLPVVEVSFG